MTQRFWIKFVPESLEEYNSLDHSIIEEVDKALESLEERADQVGKILGNRRQIELHGTREKKLRGPGVRIIYQITDRQVEVLQIVEILLVDFKKNDDKIYKTAQARYVEAFKAGNLDDLNEELWWSESLIEEELSKPSMIDQIFDENFDDLPQSIIEEILELYARGQVNEAYAVWRDYRENNIEDKFMK